MSKLELNIKFKDGSICHATDNLNKKQYEALWEHLEKGRLNNAKEIIITKS